MDEDETTCIPNSVICDNVDRVVGAVYRVAIIDSVAVTISVAIAISGI